MTRWLRRHPQVGDGLIASLLVLLSLPITVQLPPGQRLPGALFAVAIPLPLVVRRRWPRSVFAVVAVLAFAQWLSGVEVRVFDVSVLIALYTVVAYSSDRRATWAATAVTFSGAMLAVSRWHGDRLLPALIAPLALIVVALAVGHDRRTRRAYFAELEARADRLEREREALGQVAAAGERARIARELHDVVAHSLSVMIAQADGAAYTVETDPDRAVEAMTTVAETGRDALSEMRRLLGVLRPTSSSNGLAPQPGVGEISGLVAKVRDAGLPIELHQVGRPVALPPGMELAAYRIVQEALTNTIKHTGLGATATVELRYEPDHLQVKVDDDGRGDGHPSTDGSGQGLAGMRERASIYGGTVTSGRRPGGGFEITADFPIRIPV